MLLGPAAGGELLILPAAAHQAATDERAAESRLAGMVSDANLRATVRDLVELGSRMGGTPSGDAAAEHVARALRSLGLETQVIDDPPVQAFQADRWEVRVGGAASPLSSAWPYTFAPSIVPARTAPIVDMPSLARAAPGAWRGRIIYTRHFTEAGYAVVVTSQDRPVAILTSAPHEAGQYEDAAAIRALPRQPEPTVPVFALSLDDGLIVERAARDRASATVALTAETREASPRTVIATLPGSRRTSYYLLSAHGDSDSGGPGADDNASGVAVLIELARVLAALRGPDGDPLFPFDVRFVVWGAEYASARAYIDREAGRLEECLGVINIDEAGTGAEREAIYAEGNEVPWNRALLGTLEQVGRDYLNQPGFWPEFATNPTRGGTDAYAFLPTEYKGHGWVSRRIPSTTIYTAAWNRLGRFAQTPGWMTNTGSDTVIIDYSRYYHSSGDIPAHTTEREPQNMVRAAKLVGLALLRLAQSSPTP